MPDEQLAGQVAPVVDEAATTVAAQTDAATSEAQTGGAEGEIDSPETRTFTQEEVNEIVEKRLAKARRNERREALKEFQQLTGARQQPQEQAQEGEKPSRKQGETDDAYLDRLTDWKLDQREAKAKQEQAKEQANATSRKIDALYAKAEELEGFDAEAYDALPLTRSIVEAVIDSDVGPQLMKHMADNPEEVIRISKLSPARQAAELGKLEAELAEAPKKVSSAPAPINALRKPSGRPPITDTTDPRAAKELSTSDWIKAEEARMRRKHAGN